MRIYSLDIYIIIIGNILNYKDHYDKLIQKARNRKIAGYYELHHVFPKCLGGADSIQNLVKLTAREHFIAHLLLVKIYKDNYKLVKAVAMMCIGNEQQKERIITNRLYGNMRELFSIAQSISQSGSKNSQYGKKWIYNPLTKEERKITGNELPNGWVFGRYSSKENLKEQTNQRKYQDMVKLYSHYYNIYNEVGFEEFIKITGYEKSKQNLVQMFSRHIENFIPQNGKKRGSNSILSKQS